VRGWDSSTRRGTYLAGAAAARDRARRALDGAPPEACRARGDLELLPAVPPTAKLLCVGLNYHDHAEEVGLPVPAEPTLFAKCTSALLAHGAPVALPAASEAVDAEAELAVVIGRRARDVAAADALDHVGGYTALNDVTARDWQERTSQWTLCKSFDGFGPLGPSITTADEIPDPQALAIRLRVGDELLQDSSTAAMIFTVAEVVAHVSRAVTLEPGDVISTGTPAGVGFTRNPPRLLRDGDVVRVEIEGLETLANPVTNRTVHR
jgi:2-keto-4-pentenoate hydratase/2-oxohepta-3-ene-1,7-dioic acid hydratase in catechol pathway